MRRIATLNDNGNSGSSIATPSRLHKRGRAQAAKNLLEPAWRTQKLVCASGRLLAGIARKIESHNSGSQADICTATSHVRFPPNSDRKSRHLPKVMSA